MISKDQKISDQNQHVAYKLTCKESTKGRSYVFEAQGILLHHVLFQRVVAMKENKQHN